MKKVFFLVVILLIGMTQVVLAGSVTLTSYYPSPYGAYDRLKLVPRTPIAGTERCDAGTMYLNNTDNLVYLCTGGTWANAATMGTWKQTGDDIIPRDAGINPNLRVGIGTLDPGSQLHIIGPVHADAFRAFETSGVYGFLETDPYEYSRIVYMGGWDSGFGTFSRTFIDGNPLILQGRSPTNRNVGISRVPDPTIKLDVLGDIRASGNVTWSDARLKKNIVPIKDALDKVNQIRGVKFQWRDGSLGGDTQLGVIAQEIEEFFPEVVSEDSDGYKSVAYANMVAVLIEAVKELKQEVDELKTRCAE